MRYYVNYASLNPFVISEQPQKKGREDKEEIKQSSSYSSNLSPNRHNLSYYSQIFNLIEINLFSNSHRYIGIDNINDFLSKITQKQILQISIFKFSILVPKQFIEKKKENGNTELEKFLEELTTEGKDSYYCITNSINSNIIRR